MVMYGYVYVWPCEFIKAVHRMYDYVWLGMYVYVCVSQLVDMKGTMTAFGNIVHHGSISL